jgi:hypothetical protein
MNTRRLLRVLPLCVCGFVAASLMTTDAWAQEPGAINKYNNPYINDGSFATPPISFDFNITDIRNVYDEHSRRWVYHTATESPDELVKDLQQRYKRQSPVAPGYVVAGYVFLTIQQEWSFTIIKAGTNFSYVLIVGQGEQGRGSLLKLLAYTNTTQNAAYKRAWFGYSPSGLDAYALRVRAY